jgi:predicted nuclease of restriction endonuclease-like RecB superfamily
MLTKDLLRYRVDAGQIRPAFLDPSSPRYLNVARTLIKLCAEHIGKTRGALAEALEEYATGRTDYRILRGLAKVLTGFAEWETPSAKAAALRAAVFARAARAWPVARGPISPLEIDRRQILVAVAGEVGLSTAQLEQELYADLSERRRLAGFAAPQAPQALIARYNMELARGLLYWAERLTIDVADSYQDIFRYIKLCRLMHTITRHAPGYRIELDGPLSLMRGTTRYGLKMAVFLPALALCRTWRMEAVIMKGGERLLFALDDRSNLISHFRRFPVFDSQLERDFAADFQETFKQAVHGWQLARADVVIPLEGNSVMIPDFTLRRPNGQEVYLEIVGFWTPEYLSRKIEKVKAARLDNLILAVSKRLALCRAVAEELAVLWFAKKLSAAAVVERAGWLADEGSPPNR